MSANSADATVAELADVAICLLRLAAETGVDLTAAVPVKIARNERRYPAEVVRGRADHHPGG